MQYSSEFQHQYEWDVAKELTTAQAALGTDKSAATVHALTATGIARFQPDDGTVALEFRFLCSADADSNVINLYGMRGDSDHYELIATFTLTGGTQVIDSIVAVDTIAETANTEVWPTAIAVMSQANNSVAKIALNTHGYKNLLFCATTLNSASLKIQKARL